ncbi:MAG: metal-dependent transcriptional regulator [Elusimicrobia bacterium]|nr:metal-dependent transcriptional regulator [Elusimicrobiota bacterium]
MSENQKFAIPNPEQEDIEEALGVIWHRMEEGAYAKADILPVLKGGVGPHVLDVLLKRGYVREDGESLAFTAEGKPLAKDIIRRHRLAERLLSDVLNIDKSALDPNACKWEHIISPEVTESICTLLGHPVECPHGSSIPSGECCQREESRLEPIVVSMDRMSAGEEGKIAYVRLQDHPELHKLLSLGVIPGVPVHMHQTFPTIVIQLGESQLALEESAAKNIYIRKS